MRYLKRITKLENKMGMVMTPVEYKANLKLALDILAARVRVGWFKPEEATEEKAIEMASVKQTGPPLSLEELLEKARKAAKLKSIDTESTTPEGLSNET